MRRPPADRPAGGICVPLKLAGVDFVARLLRVSQPNRLTSRVRCEVIRSAGSGASPTTLFAPPPRAHIPRNMCMRELRQL